MYKKIIVTLGNPGKKYEKTRHNAAWLIIDKILKNENWKLEKKFASLICEKNEIIFLKPLTYMNLSGESVYRIMNYYKLLPKKFSFIRKKDSDLTDYLTVIHDDLDIEFGKYKIMKNSGSAGHKGVASIINNLKTKNFNRIRIGIKNDMLKRVIPADKFVLQSFNKEELIQLSEISQKIEQELL